MPNLETLQVRRSLFPSTHASHQHTVFPPPNATSTLVDGEASHPTPHPPHAPLAPPLRFSKRRRPVSACYSHPHSIASFILCSLPHPFGFLLSGGGRAFDRAGAQPRHHTQALLCQAAKPAQRLRPISRAARAARLLHPLLGGRRRRDQPHAEPRHQAASV
eukprot:scaffold4400_cov124-Isochrysis_galbana.AAC.7